VLINKPGYEYAVTHPTIMPDECTVFKFTNAFYTQLAEQLHGSQKWFFSNKDTQSLLLKTTPQAAYLHDVCLRYITNQSCSKLAADSMVMELLQLVLGLMGNTIDAKEIPDRIKKNHLPTIEAAKGYIHQNFTKDISLMEQAF
jgi:AraC family transcriptional regulator